MTDRWHEIDRWHSAALEQPPGHRVAFVRERCLDAVVRDEVLRMLAPGSPSTSIELLPPGLRAEIERVRHGPPADTPWIGHVFVDPRTGQERWKVLDIKASKMSLVYIGLDLVDERPFAAKTYQSSVFEANPLFVEAVEREAGVWIRLPAHPNVASAEGIERLEGKPYLFMMYYAQGDLLGLIRNERRIALPRAMYYAMQICDGLSHAYGHGVKVHRDIKPSNCLLFGQCELVVTDFGLARPSWSTDDPLRHGLTPAYAAPEQWADAAAADERTDVYALGATLFEMIAGHAVFGTDAEMSQAELRRQHETEPVPPMDAPPALRSVVQRCLEKSPARRFQTVREVRSALEDVFHDLTGEAAPAPRPPLIPDDDPTSLIYRAGELEKVGMAREANAMYERVLSANPDNVEAIHDRADMLFKEGQFEAARRGAERVVALRPDLVNGWLLLGNACDELRDRRAALRCYEQAAALAPRRGRVHYERALCLERLRRPAEAEAAYRRAIEYECRPDLDMALNNLGSILRRRGAFEDAIGYLERAVELNPAREQAWFHLGRSFLELRRLDRAQHCMQRALALELQDGLDWFWLGRVFQECAQYRSALVCFAAARHFGAHVEEAIQRSGFCGHRTITAGRPFTKDAYVPFPLDRLSESERTTILTTIADDFMMVAEQLVASRQRHVAEAVLVELIALCRATSNTGRADDDSGLAGRLRSAQRLQASVLALRP